ncbi:MAG: DMT family protein [Phycisphaeraceae bacterium]|nr:DMT family protein [Phycisphaeraceae bacterium]
MLSRAIPALVLLVISNIFMNFAWYYHVKVKAWPIWLAILVSWGIAFFEYCFQVPANRLGHVDYGGPFGVPQLKIIQEAITLIVFSVFTVVVLPNEKLRWTDFVAFALVLAAVTVSVLGRMNATR